MDSEMDMNREMNRRTDKTDSLFCCKMIRSSLESSRLQAAQGNALNAEHSNIRSSLNVESMVQFLNSECLLTPDEAYRLTDTSQPLGKKVDFLVAILPRKGTNWWDKFLHCLDESSTRPGLGAHKELANQLRDQLKRQLKKYEQRRSLSWMWTPTKCLKRIIYGITIQHQKTAFKFGTIFAILMVAVCTLARSNTFIINTDISDNQPQSTSSVQDIMKELVPPVDNSSDKTEAVESPSQGNTALQDGMSKTQNFTNTKDIQNGSKRTYLNEVQTNELTKSQPNGINTSHTSVTGEKFSNGRSVLMQNTSGGQVKQFSKSRKQLQHEVAMGVERERHLMKQLTTPQPDDMKVMQKQLNFTQCLLFYIEKEKMEYAELDLWRVYVALKSIPFNSTTSTERYIMSVTEALTGWDIRDLTISEQITNRLANTIVTKQDLKNLLSITDVNIMRAAQYGCNNQLPLKQVVTNYESENALLRLKHELYILRPRVSPNSTNVIAPLLYYPLLQRYVSLSVDTFSARTACLKVCSSV